MSDPITPPPLPRILLVEDHDMTRRMQVRFLSRQYAVDFASTGREAIEQAQAHPYQTILLDINLADRMNGVEVMQTIKQIPHHRATAIVAVTGYASPEDRQRLLGAGFDLYLAKPFKWKEFSEVIELAVRVSASGAVQQPPPPGSDAFAELPPEPPTFPEPTPRREPAASGSLVGERPAPRPAEAKRPAPHPSAERRPFSPYPEIAGSAPESSDGRALSGEPIVVPASPRRSALPLLPRWQSLSSF